MIDGHLLHTIQGKIILNCNYFPRNKQESHFCCYTYITVMGLCLNWEDVLSNPASPSPTAETHTRCVTLNDTDHWCVMQSGFMFL